MALIRASTGRSAPRTCPREAIGQTAEGLQPSMPVRRMLELYPKAEKVEEAGEIVRYVLDPGTELCGQDAEAGWRPGPTSGASSR